MSRRTRVLVAASSRAVLRQPLLIPWGISVVLLAGLVVLDDRYAGSLVRGVAVLVGCGLAATMDDPAGEVLSASPIRRWLRSACRLVVGAALTAPVLVTAVLVVGSRPGNEAVLPGLVVEVLALGACGTALGAGLRAWRGLLISSPVAVPALLVVALVADQLPGLWSRAAASVGWPSITAAGTAWALLVAGALVTALAWRDPAAR